MAVKGESVSIIGSYQLNAYNNGPEIFGMCPLVCVTARLRTYSICFLGNLDKGVGWYDNSNS